MSLIKAAKLIEKGLANADWDSVHKGYELLTGETVELPEHLSNSGNQLSPEAIMSVLTNAVYGLFNTEDDEPVKVNKSEQPATPKKRGRKPKAKVETNETSPSPSGASFLGDDEKLKEESKKLSQTVGQKVPRPSPVFIDVTCSLCKKYYQVHPAEAPIRLGGKEDEPSRYICNKCNSGRR